MERRQQIIFVPGLRPKPHPAVHHREMLRCLVEGIRRLDTATAQTIGEHADCFEITAWNYPFYGEYHDIEIDRAGIEAVIAQQGPSERDKREATDLRSRLRLAFYRAVDHLPIMVPQLAPKKSAQHIRDLHRYVRNDENLGASTRDLLRAQLTDAAHHGRKVLLIGHSMGSVIAYDTLWQLTQEQGESLRLDTLMTLGSPLGQRYIQRHLLGARRSGAGRYPANIENWVNISAAGDTTAIDRSLADDFAEMKEFRLVQSLEDRACWNYFRSGGVRGPLNVHAEYGYLVNEVTARFILDWWRRAGR